MAHFLVGFDGSDPAKRALEYSAQRARQAKESRVTVITVVPRQIAGKLFADLLVPGVDLAPLVTEETFRDRALERLEEAVSGVDFSGVKVELRVALGSAADAIGKAAEEVGASEVVIGFKSYESDADIKLGGTAERIVRHAPCTVVVVR